MFQLQLVCWHSGYCNLHESTFSNVLSLLFRPFEVHKAYIYGLKHADMKAKIALIFYNLYNAIYGALKHDSIYLVYTFRIDTFLWLFYWRRIQNTLIKDDRIVTKKAALLFWEISLFFLWSIFYKRMGWICLKVFTITKINNIFQLARQSMDVLKFS